MIDFDPIEERWFREAVDFSVMTVGTGKIYGTE
jgi:hypothetical protein